MDACAIIGSSMAQATLEEIACLRREPGPGRPEALTYQLLKHADEQTVVALAAMLKALGTFPANTDFGEWGIVAAPRWPGRFGTATAIERYRADGVRGVSPLAIPNVCLHSLSATVSIVFGIRGPNYGVGGGLASVADGLLAGLGVQLEQQSPGTFVILCEWDNEPGRSDLSKPPRALAVALALAPIDHAQGHRRLAARSGTALACQSFPRLAELADCLRAPGKSWSCALDGGLELAVTETARLKAAG